jgi:uncharacterized protein YbjT (DUF2867 family)
VNVLLFGATGMIGQGVLRECLLAPDVERVTIVVRRPIGRSHDKLREIVQADVTNLAPVERELTGVDACFFCVGVSAVGMTEEEYTRVTYDLTMAVATTLLRTNPSMTFIYVSGASTDSTERGRFMWARVKGRTENALLRLPFRAAYMFRPGAIIPLHGIRSSTRWYNALYAVLRPLFPIVKRVAPNMVTTTEELGRAMLAVTRDGYPSRILEMRDIRRASPGSISTLAGDSSRRH